VQLGYLRGGNKMTASVGIADRNKIFAATAPDSDDTSAPTESDAGQGKLGITVSTIPPAIASKLGGVKGVIVTSVRPDSFADDINLEKGAVIVAINKKPVTDEASYKAIVSALKPGEDVVFVIRIPGQKNGGNSYVGGTLP
jgi:serine protease Do